MALPDLAFITDPGSPWFVPRIRSALPKADDQWVTRNVERTLNDCLNNRLSLPSPSELVKESRLLKKVFGGEEPDIHIGLPGGAPAAIFSPALAALQQSFGNLGQVNISENEAFCVANYICRAVKFYASKGPREEAITELVDAANVGTTIVNCSKIISKDEYKSFHEFCNFLIIPIGATANPLEVSIAVCVASIYVTKLLTLDLSFGLHASDNVIIQLALVFKVLSRHRVDIEN
ncbi:hypothetical protein CPB84DRAFT_1844818 [Gymnopilus junonius]|uniref:Uncharacterized protein n=1 Tax=Gymnopilus junonius TaxID=109634 RepID=A0A9P5TQ13_GYMJU|nr:hypothetical protein CPB84DRAFT_1844818 [Gymnopilus junonius]